MPNEISLHLLFIYEYLSKNHRWHTAAEIADGTAVNPRTARAHLLRLVNAGIVERAVLFPEHRYRLARVVDDPGRAFRQKLEEAREIFGLGPSV